MTTRLLLEKLTISGLRNIERMELEPAPRFNVIAGDNGQGKTSILEAIYYLATSRSFRAEKLGEVRREGSELAVVTAVVCEGEQRHTQRAAIRGSTRALAIDGKRPQSMGQYATRTPVVVFHPGDMAITTGAPSLRRTLLDRIALYAEPSSANYRQRYQRATRERQVCLERGQMKAPELDAYEAIMASAGSEIEGMRRRASERLADALGPAFSQMAAPELALSIAYLRGGSEDAAEFQSELRARRSQDARRRTASYGPQRADLDLIVDGRSARRHASQGQQRVLSLAIKLAELDCVRQTRGVHPVLLLDEVSSELDPTRTGAVFDLLRQAENQVFVTTTRPELFTTPGLAPHERKDWTVARGTFVAPR